VNGWDLFTWVMTLILATSSLVIFLYFLRDARSILKRERAGDESDD
jgi:hypothetical protein